MTEKKLSLRARFIARSNPVMKIAIVLKMAIAITGLLRAMKRARNDSLRWVILFLLFFPMIVFARDTNLLSVRFAKKENITRVTIDLNQPPTFHIFSLTNPQRIVLDFTDTHLRTSLTHSGYLAADIKNVRVGYPQKKNLRIVLDLDHAVHFHVTASRKSKRILLQLVSLQPKKLQPKKIAVQRPVTVVIDAGHGGHDPGTIGVNGTREKNVVLSIARMLAQEVNDTPGMHAILTRRGDYFVPLRGRINLARRGKADLFVSIHADSWLDPDASGASVYALSQHGATKEAARWLAGRENSSVLAGVDLRELRDQSALLRSVLIDLAQTATIQDSLTMGSVLLRQIKNVTDLHYRHVEQAPFMVLKSPDIPSVLIETGYLSNRVEALRLRDKKYQGKMAHAIYLGLRDYLQKYPPATA